MENIPLPQSLYKTNFSNILSGVVLQLQYGYMEINRKFIQK